MAGTPACYPVLVLVLVLVGEQDPLVPPSSAQEAVLAVPAGLAKLHCTASPTLGIRCSGPPPTSHPVSR